MTNTLASKKGTYINSSVITFSISSVPRPVYEIARENMKKAGLSMNEVFAPLLYYWANLPSHLSAEYKLIMEGERAAEEAYEEMLTGARKEMMSGLKKQEDAEKMKLREEENEQDRVCSILRPIVSRYLNRLNFEAERGSRAFEEHNDAMGCIGLDLMEKAGINRLNPQYVKIVLESLKHEGVIEC